MNAEQRAKIVISHRICRFANGSCDCSKRTQDDGLRACEAIRHVAESVMSITRAATEQTEAAP